MFMILTYPPERLSRYKHVKKGNLFWMYQKGCIEDIYIGMDKNFPRNYKNFAAFDKPHLNQTATTMNLCLKRSESEPFMTDNFFCSEKKLGENCL